MEQEFVIKGTIEGMVKILQIDFDMDYEEAKFFIYSLMNQVNLETVNRDELDLWYLSDKGKYSGQIFNTHFAINFTTAKKSLYHISYMFCVKYLFSRGIDLVLIGADLLYLVCTVIKKVKDVDYCVFARIIELNIGSKGKLFSMKDVVTANKDGKCDYQDEDWKCTYLAEDDNCTCNMEKIELAFADLAEQNIIKKVGDFWMLLQ